MQLFVSHALTGQVTHRLQRRPPISVAHVDQYAVHIKDQNFRGKFYGLFRRHDRFTRISRAMNGSGRSLSESQKERPLLTRFTASEAASTRRKSSQLVQQLAERYGVVRGQLRVLPNTAGAVEHTTRAVAAAIHTKCWRSDVGQFVARGVLRLCDQDRSVKTVCAVHLQIPLPDHQNQPIPLYCTFYCQCAG